MKVLQLLCAHGRSSRGRGQASPGGVARHLLPSPILAGNRPGADGSPQLIATKSTGNGGGYLLISD